MGRKPTGGKTGRPEKEIDWTLFEKLCGIQCTQPEIASMLKIDKVTLINKVQEHYKHIGDDFSTIYDTFRRTGLCSFRRSQFVLARKNGAVSIHLGKVYLDQNYIQKVESTVVEKPKSKVLILPDNEND